MPDNVDGDQGSDINVPNCEQSSKSGCDEFDHIKNYFSKELVIGPKQVSQIVHDLQNYLPFILLLGY